MRFRFNPITIKRLQRFQKIRRAYASFWLLAILYTLGICAPWIANNIPFYVRCHGSSYFPLLFFYPEDEFLQNGRNTRPDYKALAQDPLFTEDPNHFIVFPPIPYGPYESIGTDSLNISEKVSVELKQKKRVGTINIRPDYSIRKSVAAHWFFSQQKDRDVRDLNVEMHWTLPQEIKDAIGARFHNNAMPANKVEAKNADGQTIQISLSRYEARTRPPKTIRLTLREQSVESFPEEIIIFDASLNRNSEASLLWAQLEEQEQNELLEGVRQRFDSIVQSKLFEVGGTLITATFHKEDVSYPFRPLRSHWLGLDSSGRDVGVRVLYALRTSLTFGFLLVLVTMIFGILVGGIQGYWGGKIDMFGQRLIEIWEALPFIYILILMGSVYGRSFTLLLVCYGMFNWIGISYYMRGEFLKLRQLPFVEAAKCMGIPHRKIIIKHILPNGLVPIITFFSFFLGGCDRNVGSVRFSWFWVTPSDSELGRTIGSSAGIQTCLVVDFIPFVGPFCGHAVKRFYW